MNTRAMYIQIYGFAATPIKSNLQVGWLKGPIFFILGHKMTMYIQIYIRIFEYSYVHSNIHMYI
jgi:hypothetical protein